MTKRACVLGHPISHSLSPLLHGYWLKKYGIDGSYEAMDIAPEQFAATLRGLVEKGYAGCNITLPYKEQARMLVDEIDGNAEKIGAVNTVICRDGKLIGSNTDAYGFLENIRASYPNWNFKSGVAMVLGAGGAARAVCFGLLRAGVNGIFLVNRTQEKADELAAQLGEGRITVIDWEKKEHYFWETSLLVNTTVLGMVGKPALEINISHLPQVALVTDVVYTPLETDLLRRAREQGNPTLDGLGMLIHQARPGFKEWFGIDPEVEPELRDLLVSESAA